MTNKDFFILFSIFLVLGAFFYFLSFSKLETNNTKKTQVLTISSVKIGEKVLKVEVADTKIKQEQGLSGREGLDESSGMLFIFNVPSNYAFWMKDMKFPIDIIWIDQNLKIVHIEKDLSPETYPLIFKPEIPAKYVLEISAGLSSKSNFRVGDLIQFIP